MALDAGAVIAHLKLDTKEFKAATGQVKAGTKTMSDSAKGAGGAFGGLWKQIAAGVGVTMLVTKGIQAIKGAITSTIEAGRAFEREWANTTTMMTLSAGETKKMKDELLKLSPTLGDSTDLAKGLYQVLSASIPAGKAIEFLGEAAKSAKAGVTDTTTAVDALSTVINAYGMQAEEVTNVSDIMFQTVKRGKLTYEEMAGALGTVVPIASQVGLGFDQIGAAMATLTRQGIDANTATVQLRQIMVSVLNPSREAEKAAKALGLEFNAQALASKGLSGFLADVKEKTHGNAETMSLLFGNVRALTGVMALAGEQAAGFKDDLEGMKNAAGSTEEAFRKQMDSLDFWIETGKNALNKLKIAFYEGFSGPIREGITNSKELELQIRILQERFEDFGRSTGKTFKWIIDNAEIIWASIKGPGEWAKEMAERASGIKALKKEILEIRIEAEDWAKSLTNLNISWEELAKNYGRDTEAGAKWRAEMERRNAALEAQKDNFSNLNGVMIASARYMRDQVDAIIATSSSSEEASRRIRELRDFMKSGGEAAGEGAKGIGEVDKAAEKYKETLDNLLESLGVSKEKEKELYDVSKLLDGLYKSGKISVEKYNAAHKELVDKMFDYGETLKTVLPKNREFKNLIDETKSSIDDMTYGIETDEDRLKFWSARMGVATNVLFAFTYEIRKLALFLQTGIMLPDLDFGVYAKGADKASETIKNIWQETSSVLSDTARKWASSIVKSFGIQKKLVGEATKHNEAYFQKAQDDVDNDYENKKRALEKELDDLEDGYDTKRQWIMDNVANEEKRRDMLEDLDRQYELSQKELQEKLVANEEWHKENSDRIRADEDKSRQEHADAEERRQNSLWTKVKDIFGTAVEDMIEIWMTKFVGKIISSIIDKIFPAFDDLGKKGQETGKTAGEGLSSGIGASVGPVLAAIAVEVAAFAGFIALLKGLDKWFDLGMPTYEEQVAASKAYEEAVKKKYGKGGTVPVIFAPSGKQTAEETEPETSWQTGFEGIVNRPIKARIGEVPEFVRVIPLSKMNKEKSPININVAVNLDGTIISDREFTRSRLLPEIISALDSPEFKGRVQQKLGVA